MADQPILLLGQPAIAERDPLRGGGTPPRSPSREHQNRYFADLQRIRDSLAEPTDALGAGDVERVVVLEVAVGGAAGLRAFAEAADRVQDLEWLLELDLEPATVDGFNAGEPVDRRLYALFTNRDAMSRLLVLWRRYQDAEDAPTGAAPIFDVFKHLTDVRLWSEADRVLDTGLESWWEQRLETGDDPIFFQAEFWYSDRPRRADQARASLERALKESGASIVDESRIPGIRYHAACVACPRAGVEAALAALKEDEYVRMLRCDEVMFFRGGGQSAVAVPPETQTAPPAPALDRPLPSGSPIVALLDGLPLGNHTDLVDRVQIVDPDDFAARYPAGSRRHGTAMASQIVHGDLALGEAPLGRPIHARPVMHPGGSADAAETWPADRLFVDLFHRAVRGIVCGDGAESATAPSVRIVNVSLGNAHQRFLRELSPLARLIDFLAWEHNLLFLVSAGNVDDDVQIDLTQIEFDRLTPEDRRAAVLGGLQADRGSRRLLSPAEAVNALTVGSLHADGADEPARPGGIAYRDLLDGRPLPSPINPIGAGWKRSVKPEILLPGGRQYYGTRMNTGGVSFRINHAPQLPGQLVAAPSTTPGVLGHRVHTRGTSNAAANATRLASRIFENLLALREETDAPALADDRLAVLTKALLVHGASWGTDADELDAHCGPNDQKCWRAFRQNKAAALGFGAVDPERSRVSTDQRVLLLGTGRLNDGEAATFRVPIPSALGGKKLRRRVVLTLAWLSPLNPRHRGHTRAGLFLTHEETVAELLGTPRDADETLSRRGSVQHLVFETDAVVAVGDDDHLDLKVNCRETAGGLTEDVPFGLAVTVEAADPYETPIFSELRDRLAGLVQGARVPA
ncbi:S8 family peptidase [Phycisphaera mikurensis]|uniref:Peptidase S8/S53 domain-containing protein n=1 Tax=Phycisphaera mikurensis (strain NBRC 102666 / KCTC 22515 / FYK2301M01) TaxID=1142394 RepID=I0IF57_PHYMF|nr:S8 family peptidase [Phycisphaera mikurensis]MBB6440709.1 hypothetical protein [Phycisphaera mikurensis]BAM03895.1 hypothetical protein PSMK_17360 [Phycisphaera mikurensis NBRC 102666]